MAGQRKTLGSLVDTAPPAPPAVSVTSPDRPARADRPASSAAAPASEAPAKPAAGADMTMRSWYMPKASAERLAALVDDVHFATRLPKHLIMGALVHVVDRHRAEVEAEARSAAGQ
jgi:hypothetical protein